MAWHAKLTNPVAKPGRLMGIYAEFVYYDDVDGLDGNGVPLKPLHYAEFRWPATETTTQMRNDVIKVGQDARDVKAKADQLTAAFPVATTIIDIP